MQQNGVVLTNTSPSSSTNVTYNAANSILPVTFCRTMSALLLYLAVKVKVNRSNLILYYYKQKMMRISKSNDYQVFNISGSGYLKYRNGINII